MCHQSVSLTARHLEENGIATVIFGSARDIVEHCGVPRFVFTDFPLGNACGRPWDEAMQREILEIGFRVLESARFPRTTVQTPYIWDEEHTWRRRYLHIEPQQRAELARLGEERRRARARDRADGRVRA